MKIPKDAFEKFFAMTGLIILFLAACSNRLHAPAVNHEMPKTVYLTHVVTVHDTIPFNSKTHRLYSDDTKFREHVEKLMEETSTGVSNMTALNVEWQRNTLIFIERLRSYRAANDSLYFVVKDIRTDLRAANTKADHYYKQYQEAQEAKKQYDIADRGINWQVYIGFGVIVIFLGAIQWKLKKMGPAQREKLNYL